LFHRSTARRAWGIASGLAGVCLGLWAATVTPARAMAAAGAGDEPAGATTPRPSADFAGRLPSADARRVADWIAGTGDNHSLPFVIVDKKQTRVFVFDAQARLLGATSALLGSARGDESAPGIGERKLADIRPEERTTAAGRFEAALGRDLSDQDVLWVDYKAALALHRVLSNNSREHRLERLAKASPLDHRITFGCIDVPVTFYDRVVHPTFAGTRGVVYVLPEVRSLSDVFLRTFEE
jgi:hypothetical protein